MTIHVWGAAGYAAAEAIRLLSSHPQAELGVLESRSHAGDTLGDHFPLLRRTEYRFSDAGSVLRAVRDGDVVLAAGAHGEAREWVPRFLDAGARVIDLSADYRFDDTAAYGLSEWNRADISGARLVANPGCYPTATLLSVLPLLTCGNPLQIVVDAKSGITGAGRRPAVTSLFAEVAGDVRPYGLDGHRHQPEIERIVTTHRRAVPLTFTPHVVPLARGMLVDSYIVFEEAPSTAAISKAFAEAYGDSRFVDVLDSSRVPSVAAVVGTNHAEIRADVNGSVVRAICAIDNLGKGAAGQAVQNLNIMLDLREDCGLDATAVVA